MKTIEPVGAQSLPNDFKIKYNSQAYYFTLKDNVPIIIKNGISTKFKNKNIKKYREFPYRIYLYMSYEDIDKLDKNELYDFLRDIFGDDIDFKDISVIKIDLSDMSVDIYKDIDENNEKAVFVYKNIPSNSLREVKVEL